MSMLASIVLPTLLTSWSVWAVMTPDAPVVDATQGEEKDGWNREIELDIE